MEALKIHLLNLGDEPLVIREELPASALELNEPLARASKPLKVDLVLQRMAEGDILVSGRLETVLALQCGRCAEWLDWPVQVDNFHLQIEKPKEHSLDLTPHVREDILLQLPLNAVCRLDPGYRCPYSGKSYPPDTKPPVSISNQEVWKELDKLKIKKK